MKAQGNGGILPPNVPARSVQLNLHEPAFRTLLDDLWERRQADLKAAAPGAPPGAGPAIVSNAVLAST